MSDGLLRVNFSLRGFSKVVRHADLSAFTPDPQALIGFGRFLAAQPLQKEAPITFVSIPEFRGIDYVGYIIEKERLDRTNGTWQRIEEFKIIGSQANSFKDSRVAYGEVYRYRLRSVVKFTTFNSDSKLNNNSIAQGILALVKDQIDRSITKNQSLIAQLSAQGLQTKGSTPSTVSLGNNISATVDSNNVPKLTFDINDPTKQAKLSGLNGVLKDIQNTLSSNIPINDSVLALIKTRLAQNGVSIPDQVKIYVSEYLTSNPTKNWMYVTVTEDVLPPPPASIKIIPSSPNQNITVYWLPPADVHLDLDSVTLYRRENVGDPWAILAENMPLNTAVFTDTDVSFGKQYIYALSCTDKHGYKSFLSTQIQAELNRAFRFEKRELPLRWISGAGARPEEVDAIFKKFYTISERIIAHSNIRVGVSKTFAGTNTALLLRIKSLDTHQTRELVVNLNNKSLQDK